MPESQIPGNKLPKNAIPKTPLVLFFNSNETDLITLNSNLIQSQYPNIYDDEIFVYALCDKPLAFLNYIIDMRNFQSNQKPIFLLLHIPEEKLKLKNIKIIIYQIYYFLSFICDIAVTVLNKKDFVYQLSLVENISTIKSKYNIEQNQMSKRNLSLRKMINDDDDDDFSSDEDEIKTEKLGKSAFLNGKKLPETDSLEKYLDVLQYNALFISNDPTKDLKVNLIPANEDDYQGQKDKN